MAGSKIVAKKFKFWPKQLFGHNFQASGPIDPKFLSVENAQKVMFQSTKSQILAITFVESVTPSIKNFECGNICKDNRTSALCKNQVVDLSVDLLHEKVRGSHAFKIGRKKD